MSKYAWSGSESNKRRTASRKISFMGDVSSQNIYSISQQESSERIASPSLNLDNETFNLINWLVQQQGVSPEMALKKAVATAAYIHDLTANEGGRLLVQVKDGSVHEIILK